MSADNTIPLADAEATTALGARIAPLLRGGDAVRLYGPLGMGKSTLARGLIRAPRAVVASASGRVILMSALMRNRRPAGSAGRVR